MKFIKIPLYRIVPAPQTGIGWVAAQKWNSETGSYKFDCLFRSPELAEEFIERELKRED